MLSTLQECHAKVRHGTFPTPPPYSYTAAVGLSVVIQTSSIYCDLFEFLKYSATYRNTSLERNPTPPHPAACSDAGRSTTYGDVTTTYQGMKTLTTKDLGI